MFPFNRLSIQSRLILLLLTVSLGSILVVAWIGYASGKDAITRAVDNHLQGVRAAKTAVLKKMLETTRNEVIRLSDTPSVIDAMRGFRGAWQEVKSAKVQPEWDAELRKFYEGEFLPPLAARLDIHPTVETYLPKSTAARYLQYHYIAASKQYPYEKKQGLSAADDDSEYTKIHRRFHPLIAKEARLFKFEDVMLVDSDSLDIIYTYQKTAEFATNLRDGPYADTNLGEMVRALSKSKDRDDYKFADFEFYPPSLGRPAAFAGSPIFDGPKMIGILVFQFYGDEFTRALTGDYHWEQEGMGKTGEVIVVGPDYLMRSEARSLKEDQDAFLKTLRDHGVPAKSVEQIERQGSVILNRRVKNDWVEQALQGKEGMGTADFVHYQPALSSYGPIDMDSLRWAVIAKMETSEAYEPIRAFGQKVLAAAVGLALLVSLLALVLSHFFVRPIHRLAAAARQVSAGRVDVQVPANSRDEFRELADAFNQMTRGLKAKTEQLEHKARENEELLLSILPAPAAQRLREGDGRFTQTFADVTVLFAELHGFDAVAERLGADKALALYQNLVVAFDEAAERLGVEKIKTVGSSYMAVCGLSVQRPDHAARMVEFAQEVVRIVKRFNLERGTELSVETGVNAGPVVGGVVGRSKFIFDLWGETVTVARALRNAGGASIQASGGVHERLSDLYPFQGPGEAEVKGKGRVPVWSLKV